MNTAAEPQLVRTLLITMAASLLLAACGGGGDDVAPPPAGSTPPPSSAPPPAPSPMPGNFQLLPARVNLDVGSNATVLAYNANGAITWSTSDPAVASVDANGVVTGVSKGSATVRASVAGTTLSAPIKVWDTTANPPDPTTDQLIAKALGEGRIDAEQALIYRVYALFGDNRLPLEFDGAAAVGASGAMREVSTRFASLSDSAQATLQPFLIPPIYLESWLGVQLGVAPAQARKANGARALSAINCSGTFPGLYKKSTANFNVVATPLIGFNSKFNPVIDYLASIAEEIYAAETSLLNRFPKPDLGQPCDGGDGKIDIYVSLIVGSNDRGLTTAYGGRCEETPAFVQITDASVLFGYEQGGDAGQIANLNKELRATLAHEFLHTIQYGMDRSAACVDYDWIDEATAQWVIDYVYPVDNVEDGRRQVATGRSGEFYANYLYNDHMASIEKPAPGQEKLNGYTDYVFFQFVALKYSAGAIKSIFDAMLTHDSVAAMDVGLQGVGSMQAVWPEFAKSLWLDKENASLPSVLESDGYDYGIAKVFAQTSQPFSTKKKEPTQVDQKGAPGATHRLLKAAEVGSNYEIPARSFFYEYLKFTDSAVSTVVISNALAGPAGDGLKVEVLKKIGGQWSAAEDITERGAVGFCRDKRAERIEEMLIIVSNSEAARDAVPIQIPAVFPMQVSTSNVGCWRYTGTTRIAQTNFGSTENSDATLTLEMSGSPLILPLGIGQYRLVSGSLTGESVERGVCIYTRRSSGAIVTASLGPALQMRLGVDSGEGFVSRLVSRSDSFDSFPAAGQLVCPNETTQFATTKSFTWLETPREEEMRVEVHPDGTIRGTYVRAIESGTRTMTWDLRPLRE